ncbi:MAG TPA: DUF6384 family protein [Rhodospirillales bacterium]|nr:DUF6384 family protein [Rhodospirillales bacterium]
MAATSTSAATAAAPAPLDDVMLAMDVVDSLRHADKLVERELGTEERDRELKERLRRLYAAQGIDVPEHILEEGVQALREDRFTYRPAPGGLRRSLALIWVRRGRILKVMAIALGLAAAGGGAWYFGIQLPEEQRIAAEQRDLAEILPQQMSRERDRVLALAREDRAKVDARTLASEAEAALAAGDAQAARDKVGELTALRRRLEQSYVLRIVSRPGQQSGVWRVPRLNPQGRNYYVVVEAIDAKGQPVRVPVTSEENNRTAEASTFGIRVDERTFERVRADKQDDGIIQNNRFGEKQVGYLEPRYNFPTPGGVILDW